MRTGSIVGVLLLLAAAPARANCAEPPGYVLNQSGSSVEVCLKYGSCQGSLLRQALDSGVVLEYVCADARCYRDDCVEPGTYRYGLKSPLVCGGCGNDAPYWTEVTITEPPPAGCSRTSGTPVPSTYDAAPPWPARDDPSICRGGLGCGCYASNAVFGFNGALAALACAWLWRRRRA
jgi:hypothetical protein